MPIALELSPLSINYIAEKKESKLLRLSKGFTGYREISQGLYVACDLRFAVIQSVYMPGNEATDVNRIYFWICCIVLLVTKQHDKFKQGSSSVLNQEQCIPNCQFGEEIFVSLTKDDFLFCLEKKKSSYWNSLCRFYILKILNIPATFTSFYRYLSCFYLPIMTTNKLHLKLSIFTLWQTITWNSETKLSRFHDLEHFTPLCYMHIYSIIFIQTGLNSIIHTHKKWNYMIHLGASFRSPSEMNGDYIKGKLPGWAPV